MDLNLLSTQNQFLGEMKRSPTKAHHKYDGGPRPQHASAELVLLLMCLFWWQTLLRLRVRPRLRLVPPPLWPPTAAPVAVVSAAAVTAALVASP